MPEHLRGRVNKTAAVMMTRRLSMRWRHDVGDALIAENLAHTSFGRLSPDSHRAGPMSATEALGTQAVISLTRNLSRRVPCGSRRHVHHSATGSLVRSGFVTRTSGSIGITV